MLFVPTAELRLVADSQSGVRPAANYGTSVTPGNNTYSSYVDLLSATSEDADWIEININSIATSATATDTLVTIGVDPAGGTSYTDTIQHLICSAASLYATSHLCGGIWYRFPLRIPAGASLGVKATQNNSSPVAASVLVRLYRQSRLDVGPRIGSYVKTFGATTASSAGTAVTPGTSAEGSWVQLGSAVGADDNLFFWQIGAGLNNSAMAGSVHHVDLGIGDASNKRIPIIDALHMSTTIESTAASYRGAYAEAASGDLIYGRAQSSGSAPSGFSLIAYGVGG